MLYLKIGVKAVAEIAGNLRKLLVTCRIFILQERRIVICVTVWAKG